MKKLLVFFTSFALFMAGFIPLTSASNLQNSLLLNTNILLRQNFLNSQNILTVSPQEGDLSTLVGSGQVATLDGIAEPHQMIIRDTKEKPVLTNKQIRERQGSGEERSEGFIPIAEGPAARAAMIYPPTDAPANAISADTGRVTTPQAPNDMTIFRQHDMSAVEAPLIDRSHILEPTAISVGNAVLYTANWFAARSVDGGQTFTYINPYTVFPPINGGFCCDQVTAYAPNHNMAIWGLQYIKDATSGTLRLARAIGAEGIGANTWTYWNFNPQMFGFAAGTWMDFPNLSVGTTYLYAASNVFTATDVFAGNVIWRIPLASLVAGGAIPFSYFTRTDINTIRLADGSTTTMYWAAFVNTTTMRIHRWDDTSGTIFWDNVALNAFTYLTRGTGISMTADGKNWADRGDSRPLGAYVANGIIGVLWMACQDATFPQPYTIHARFNQGTRALVTQQQIWNPTFAWLYPNVSVNAASNLGGVIAYGGGTGAAIPAFPHAAFWVVDDVQAGLPMGGSYLGILGNAGPSGNYWGDYLGVRRHSLFPNTWVAAIYALNGSMSVPRYLWFGRQRDLEVGVSEFDGDGLGDIGVFRPGTGVWYLSQSTAGFLGVGFGAVGDLAAPGDYDGDGETDIAVFRPGTGTWYLLRSSLGFTAMGFGAIGDIPAVGDFDNDGKADVCVFRPSTGTWYMQRSSAGFMAMGFGASGDYPAVGDYDRDGRSDIAVFRPTTGIWYIQRSALGFTGVGFGAPGDRPVPGDYDGDSKTDVAVFRPTTGTWYALRSSLGFTAFAFGANGDRPAPADYDGDLRTDYAVFRPSTGTWYIMRSTLGFYAQAFGSNGDVPTAGAYIP